MLRPRVCRRIFLLSKVKFFLTESFLLVYTKSQAIVLFPSPYFKHEHLLPFTYFYSLSEVLSIHHILALSNARKIFPLFALLFSSKVKRFGKVFFIIRCRLPVPVITFLLSSTRALCAQTWCLNVRMTLTH